MRILLFSIVTLIGSAALAPAQEPPVPESVQFPLICKALTFDRDLAQRCGDTLTFCVMYQKRNKHSLSAKDRIVKAAHESGIASVNGIPLVIDVVEFDADSQWHDSVTLRGADILYFTPVKPLNYDAVLDFSRTHMMLTAASLPEFVQRGMAIGVGVENSKPKFVINVKTSREEGAAFSSLLLKLAIIVNDQ